MELFGFDAFVLDLDGTLLDSGKFHARAFADAVLELGGYALAPTEHDEFFASHSKPFAQVLNRRHGLALDPEKVLARKRERMKEIFRAELFPGAREFLDRWHGVRPLGLATNSPRSFVRPALEATGIASHFDCVVTADDVVNRKPDPEIYRLAFQWLEVEPGRAVVFEDQLIGVEAARAAGAQVVAVDNGQPVAFPAGVAVATWRELLENGCGQ